MEAMEQTNLVLAKILQLAMAHGISHWRLSFTDLGLEEEYATYFYPCVKWLEEEGLIRVGSYERTIGGIAEGHVSNISLTSLGMAVLGQEVEIEGAQEKFSDTVQKVSEGKLDLHRIGDAIGGLIGGIVKSLGS